MVLTVGGRVAGGNGRGAGGGVGEEATNTWYSALATLIIVQKTMLYKVLHIVAPWSTFFALPDAPFCSQEQISTSECIYVSDNPASLFLN